MENIKVERDYKAALEQIRQDDKLHSKIHQEVVLRLGKEFFGREFTEDIEVTNEIARLAGKDLQKAQQFASKIKAEKEKAFLEAKRVKA